MVAKVFFEKLFGYCYVVARVTGMWLLRCSEWLVSGCFGILSGCKDVFKVVI